ncbi:MAG: MATE family efflux transporter [Anaerovoracaceae bacterium]
MRLEGKSLRGDFFRFIIPAMIAQIVFSLYSMVDGIFVSYGVGEVALAAINISMPFLMFLFAIALVFAVGSSTIIAVLIGEGKENDANKMYTQNLITVAVISVIFSLIVVLFNDEIALFLGATDSTIEYVKDYITTISIFSVFFIISYTFEILIQTDGFPTLATLFVISGVVSNCILDYVFVILLDKGVFGAAFATGLSQVIVISLFATHFLSKRTHMKFVKFTFDRSLFIRSVRNGMAAGITELSPGIVIFLFNHSIIKYLGEDALISYTIIAYVSSVVMYGITGVAQGIQPLVSYHYGGGRIEKCKKLFVYAMKFSCIFSIVAFILTKLFAGNVVNVFISNNLTELKMYSVYALGIYTLSYFVVWMNIVIGGYLTAIERAKSSMAISIGRGLIFVSISLIILTAVVGGSGIWISAIVSEGMCLVLSFILLREANNQIIYR